jgi:hypothetical protein
MKSQQAGMLKILYVIFLSVVLFFIKGWLTILVIAFLQTALWLYKRLHISAYFRALFKLKWFILVIFIAYALIQPYDGAQGLIVDFSLFSMTYYPDGMLIALLMIARLALLLMASLWVRLSSSREQFTQALKSIKLPESVAVVTDLVMTQLVSDKPKNKKNKQQGKNKKKRSFSWQQLKTNKGQIIQQLIEKSQAKSLNLIDENYPHFSAQQKHDIVVLMSVVAAIMSLKMLQLLPGIPIAPGHKNLLVIPLLLLASLSTHSRYGGLAAGLTTGIVSFFLGFGKFGVFEILHFAIPGLVADLLVPVIRKAQGKTVIIKLMLIGAIIGLSRFAANLAILILVGTPKLAWVIFLPVLTSQVIFGALSSFVCLPVLKKHQSSGWFTEESIVDKTGKINERKSSSERQQKPH